MTQSDPKPPAKPSHLKSVWYEVAYAWDRTFKTGKRRAEFEHKYGAHGDYFGYLEKPYEQEKYARTLKDALALRRGRGTALEIGCSVGVFTKMIAPEFDAVTATDISQQALDLAAAHVDGIGKVDYARSDLVSLDLEKTFDVIFCAEVLMYVPETEAPLVCDVLAKHLKPDGIIIEVSQSDRSPNRKFFHGWDRILGDRFDMISKDAVIDPSRPYEIVAYARGG